MRYHNKLSHVTLQYFYFIFVCFLGIKLGKEGIFLHTFFLRKERMNESESDKMKEVQHIRSAYLSPFRSIARS